MSRGGDRILLSISRLSSNAFFPQFATAAAAAAAPAPAAPLPYLDQQQQQQQLQPTFQLSPMWPGASRAAAASTRGGGARGGGGGNPLGGGGASSGHLRPPLHPQGPQLHHHPLLPLQARGVATAATGGARHQPTVSALVPPPPPALTFSPSSSPLHHARGRARFAFAAFATDPTLPASPAPFSPLLPPPLPAGARLYLRPTGTGNCEHIGEKLPLPPAIPLREGTVYEVGRAEPSDIVLRIPTVSTRHALLRVDGGGRVSVTDLNSTNGTAVNGVELTAGSDGATAELPTGGEVVFGDSFLARFQLEVVVGERARGGAGVLGGGMEEEDAAPPPPSSGAGR